MRVHADTQVDPDHVRRVRGSSASGRQLSGSRIGVQRVFERTALSAAKASVETRPRRPNQAATLGRERLLLCNIGFVA